MWVYGGSGMGKTKWAASLASNPCMIKPFDSVGCVEAIMRKFDPSVHDVLILDEADLTFFTRVQAIAFVDADEDFEMDVRFKSFTMPRGVKKIIISNPPPSALIPSDPHGAIMRRIVQVHVTAPTWLPQPMATAVAISPAAAMPAAVALSPVTQPNI